MRPWPEDVPRDEHVTLLDAFDWAVIGFFVAAYLAVILVMAS